MPLKTLLKTLLLHLERPHVQELVVDFEAAIWAVARDVMPHITIRGCAFHWTQAVKRKVQSIGLQGSYTNDVATHKIIRRIIALPFLPAEHISVMFQSLGAKADSPKLRELMSYVYKTLITNPVWSPRDWSVYNCEGWHNRLNRRAKRGQLPFSFLVHLLHEESQMVKNQAHLLGEGKLSRYQRKKYRQVHRIT